MSPTRTEKISEVLLTKVVPIGALTLVSGFVLYSIIVGLLKRGDWWLIPASLGVAIGIVMLYGYTVRGEPLERPDSWIVTWSYGLSVGILTNIALSCFRRPDDPLPWLTCSGALVAMFAMGWLVRRRKKREE